MKPFIRKTALIAVNYGLLTALAVPVSAANSCRVEQNIDFNKHGSNYRTYTQSMAASDFGQLLTNAAGDVRGFDRPGKTWPARNTVGNGVLRANYPARIAGGTNTGFLFDSRINGSEEAVFEYRVKFGPEFHWAAGGKLPGLGGMIVGQGRVPVGCTTDRKAIENGFSARLMWRKGGRLVAYTYFPERNEAWIAQRKREGKSACGIDHSIATVQPDRWYTVRQYIKMNTPGKKNGILRVSIDGTTRLNLGNVEYRLPGKGALKLNEVIYHTYRGGGANDSNFHSPRNEYIYFDNFKVWSDCNNPGESAKPPSTPPPPPPTTPAISDQSCTVAGNSIEEASTKFAAVCGNIARRDCDNVSVNGVAMAVCSSADVNAANPIPAVAANGQLLLQAEDYARNVDSTTANIGGKYRQGTVDIQASSDTGGGWNVGWTADGEWLEYDVVLDRSTNYSAQLRVASTVDTGLLSIFVDGQSVAPNESVPYTGGHQSYQTMNVPLGSLAKGYHRIRVKVESGLFNLNWLRLQRPTDTTTPTPETPPATPLSCNVSGIEQWGSTFVINTVTVKNTSTKPVDWKVALKFGSQVKLAESWRSSTQQTSGTVISASGLSYNRTLQPGASTTFGMKGTSGSAISAINCQ